MDTHVDTRANHLSDIQAEHLSDASRHLHDAESRINRQQKLAERLQKRGHLREARRAREILSMFVKSYFLMQDHRQTLELELSQAPRRFPSP